MGRLFSMVTITICGLLPSLAAAQPVARVELSVPDSCPGIDVFDDLVRARLGYAALQVDAERVIQLSVSEAEGGFVGSLSEGGTETRSVRGPSCDTVLEALSMLAALAIDPLGEGASAPSQGPPPYRGSTVVELPEDLSALDHEAPPPRARTEIPTPAPGPGVFGQIDLETNAGLMPAVTVGGGFGAGLAWPGLLLVAEAHIEATPTDASLQIGAVRGRLWRAGLGPCIMHGFLRACASLQAGRAHVSSDLPRAPSSGSAWVSYGVARFGLETEAVGATWGASLQLLIALLKPDLRLGDETVWEAPPVAGGVSLSVRLGTQGRD